MGRACGVLGLALWLSGCASTVDERAGAYNEDGVNLFQHGDYRAAQQSFQAALALKPKDPGLLFNIGECYDRVGDAANAERYYRACLRRALNHPACHHALAVLLVRQGRLPEATRLIAAWMVREPKRATPYAEEGWLWEQAGDLPRAQADLQQALALDAHDVRALTELALVYEAMHRPDRAIVLYERALETDPRQPHVVRRLQFLKSQGAGRPHPD